MPVDMGNAVELAIAGLFGGGLTEIIRALSRRRREKVDTTVTLNDQAMKYVESLQKSEEDARKGEQEAWGKLREARSEMQRELDDIVAEMRKQRQLAEVLTYRFRVLTGAIMGPNASVESLRELVKDFAGGYNGSGG